MSEKSSIWQKLDRFLPETGAIWAVAAAFTLAGGAVGAAGNIIGTGAGHGYEALKKFTQPQQPIVMQVEASKSTESSSFFNKNDLKRDFETAGTLGGLAGLLVLAGYKGHSMLRRRRDDDNEIAVTIPRP